MRLRQYGSLSEIIGSGYLQFAFLENYRLFSKPLGMISAILWVCASAGVPGAPDRLLSPLEHRDYAEFDLPRVGRLIAEGLWQAP